MRHHGPGLPGTGRRRIGLTALRATAAAAMIFGSLTAGLSSVGAQADEDEGTYESPTYGYTLSWDPDAWTVEGEDEAATNPTDRDFLSLTDVDSTTQLYVEGAEGEFDDTDECVETLFPELDVDPADGEIVEDENGDPFEASDDERAYAAYVIPVELSDGDTQDLVLFVECRADPDSDLMVAFSGRSGIVDGWVEDGYPIVSDIVDTLELAGGSSGGSPEASDDEDASPSDEDEDASPSDEDEDASPSRRASPSEDEDASPSDDEDASPSDDEDADPSPSRRASASDDEDASPSDSGGSGGSGGVDGNQYESPTYGYGLEWDEDVWTVEDESSDDDIDQLELSSDTMTAYVYGYADDTDAADCIDTYVDVISDRGGSDAAVFEDPDTGDPAISVSDDGTIVNALIVYTDGDTGYASSVTCAAFDDGMLAVEFTGEGATIVEDEESDLISDVLSSITLP